MKYETITEPGYYVNTAVAENLGITVSEELLETAAESFDSISS